MATQNPIQERFEPSLSDLLALSRDAGTSNANPHELLAAEQRIAEMSQADFDAILCEAEQQPSDPTLQLWVGLVLARRGDHQAACEAFGRALDLGLGHWRVAWYVARSAAKLGQVELVDQACDLVMRANPQFWFARELPKHARGFYAQMDQDKVIEEFFQSQPPKAKVFVEVGAFDGVHYSNVRRLHERHGWSGVCVEPVEKNFTKLKSSYESTSVQCVRAAVADTEGEIEMHVSTYPHLPDWGSDVASITGESCERWQTEYGAEWRKEKVALKKLTTIIVEAGITQVDLLSIDAEGHDLAVLKSLDFARFAPQLIVVEYGNEREPIAELLGQNGYSLLQDNGQDLIAARIRAVETSGVQVPAVRAFTGSSGRPGYEEIQKEMEGRLNNWIGKPAEEIERIVVVGGFCGYEVRAFLRNYPKAEIHVFEPSQRYFPKLTAEYGTEPRVKCHCVAVGDKSGQAKFHEGSLDGVGSLLPLKTESDHQSWIPANFRPAESYTVPVTTLDQFEPLAGKAIDLLWCDVQGGELAVLAGAANVLKRTRALFLEVATTKTTYHGQCKLGDLNRACFKKGFYLAGIGLCPSGNGTGNAVWLRLSAAASNVLQAQQWHSKVNPHLLKIGYLPSELQVATSVVPALDLVTPQRFDLAAKTLYARHKMLGDECQWALELYKEHIRVFSGKDCREGDGSKNGVADYVRVFDALIQDVGQRCFDAGLSLVPTGQDGVIIDGSHRVAACVAHDVPASILHFDITANTYGSPFFKSRGLDVKYADAMALEYCRLRTDTYVVMLYPAASGRHSDVQAILQEFGQIVYEKPVELNRQGSYNLIRQVYAGEKWLGDYKNQFAGAWGKANPCFEKTGPLRVFLFQAEDIDKVRSAKKRIRDLFSIENHSVHINDTHEQAMLLARMLFNANSIHFLNHAQPRFFDGFERQIESYSAWLAERGYDSDRFCIDGSAVLAAYGLRDSADLDVLHFGEADFSSVEPEVNSHNTEVHHHVVQRDDIIFNPEHHFYFLGLKFASLDVIRRLKAKRNEPKDQTDVAAIDRISGTEVRCDVGWRDPANQPAKSRPQKIVGLVPARNEAKRLPFCLRALAKYTDAIIYLDDCSEDDSVAVVEALATECRVERIIRKERWYRDEPGDRNKLLAAGREVEGTHFVVIDADEAFTSNCADNSFLRKMIGNLLPGDQLFANWIQLWRSDRKYRFDDSVWTWNYKGIAFCDDGRCSYSSEFIHTPRVPANLVGGTRKLPGYVHGLMHFQFVDWRNLLAKQAWYRCLERLHEPHKPSAAINQRYAPSKDERGIRLLPVPHEWLSEYSFYDPTVFTSPDIWREQQVLGWFEARGREHFKDLDIWDIDWSGPLASTRSAHEIETSELEDPTPKLERLVAEAESAADRGDLASARKSLDRALDFAPNMLDLAVAAGCLALNAGDLHAARWEFVRALALSPGFEPALLKLAEVAAALDRSDEFESSMKELFEKDPEHSEALRLLVRLSLARKNWPGGAQVCRRILNKDPNDVEALESLRACFAALGDAESAAEVEKQLKENAQKKEISCAGGPLVSAIVSTYKSGRFIRGCLEDLTSQTLFKKGLLEIIVVDTGSPENEGSVVAEFQERYAGVNYIRTEDRKTIYAAWNTGVEAAKGKYLTNANTDDRHRADALEFMATYLEQHPEAGVVYGDQLITNVPNDTFAQTEATERWGWPEFTYEELERRCILGSQPMWRRQLHDAHGMFISELRCAGDYEFWLRIGKREKIVRLPEVLGLYYRNETGEELGGGNSQKEAAEVRENYGIAARNVPVVNSIPVAITRDELERLPWRCSSKALAASRRVGFDPARPDYANTPVSTLRANWPYSPADLEAEPVVTIVTPFFNTGVIFDETARSVLNQSFQQWEWLIINDASTSEEAKAVLERYRKADPRIKVIEQPRNCGPGSARNRGVQLSKGDYIVLLDSDDLLEPTALEKWLWFLESHPEHGFVKGFSIGFGAKNYLWANGFHNRERFLQENLVDLTSMIRKSVLTSTGGFEEQMKSGFEDWEFWLRCASKGHWGATVPEYLDWYRRRDNHNDRWANWDSGARQHAAKAELQKKYSRLQKSFPCPAPRLIGDLELQLVAPASNKLRKSKRRVLMILPWITMGGADKFNLDLLEQLTLKDWEVSCATTLQGDHSWMPQFLRFTPDVFALSHFLEVADYPRFLSYLIESRQIDTVLISNSMMGYQLLPFLRSRFPQVAFLDYCHMEQEDWLDGGYPQMAARLTPCLDLNIVSSHHLKNWIVRHGGKEDQVEVCYTNIDASAWQPDCEVRRRVRDELGLPESHQMILYAGRVVEQKQPKVFAETVRLLQIAHSDFTAVVAGDGPDLPWLKEFVAKHRLGKNVRFLGNVSNNRIRDLMLGADIFFLPSQWEGISLSIFEAMACGLAVVGAQVGGQRELVLPGTGFLLPRADVASESQAYAATLSDLVRNPSKIRAVGQAARDRVSRHFLLNQMGGRMVELFDLAHERLRHRETPNVSVAVGMATAKQVANASRIPLFLDTAVEKVKRGECREAIALFQQVRECAQRGNNGELVKSMDETLAELEKLVIKPASGSTARNPTGAPPQVSVIIPCYNYARLLPEAVESVLHQTFQDFEIIIVNDGSTDDTAEVAQKLMREHSAKHRIRLVDQANSGQPAAARNAGIKLAIGQYILPLDADDKIAATFLEKTVKVLSTEPGTDVVYTHIKHFGSIDTVYATGAFDRAVMARDNVIPYCSLYRRKVWEKAGGYKLMGYEDWDFWLTLLELGCKGKQIPEPLFCYRKHGSGMLNQDNAKREKLVATMVLNHPGLYDEVSRKWAMTKTGQKNGSIPAIRCNGAVSHALQESAKPALRVTYLISSIQGVTGGNQTLLRQAEELRRMGHDVTIVTYTPKPDWFQFGVKVIQVPAGQTMARHTPPSDVVVATYFTNAFELPAIQAPVKIYYAQGDQFVFGDATLPDTEENRKLRQLSRQSYQLPGIRFVPNSQNLAAAVQKTCGRRPDAILPVCTDQTIFRPLQRSVPGSRTRILIVGPDSRGTQNEPLLFKGIQDIHDGLQILARRYPHFTAVRMSSTPPEIFQKFPCEFYIAPSDEMKTMLYGTAQILVYASHYDSCPRPPQEAMAAGCAVICTATSGAAEYCRHDENALLIPIASPDAIADALEKLMKDHRLRDKLIQGGFVTAREYPREREWEEWEAMLLRFHQETQRSRPANGICKTPPREGTKKAVAMPACGMLGHLGRARELLKQKKLSNAWQAALEAIDVRPHHPEAFLLLAEIAQAAGDSVSARLCGQHARSLAPSWKPAKKFLKGSLHGRNHPDWLLLPKALEINGAKQQPRISVCLITRNEERFLAQCLNSVKGLANQIVVVDTGSTDRTKDIALECGAEVHDFVWCDDFSAARNEALRHATGDWVLMLDADEELVSSSREALIRLARNKEVIAWRLPLFDAGREDEGCNYVPRFFRNAPGLFYVGRIHEQVFSSIEVRRAEWGLENRLGDATIRHHGYTAELLRDRNKIARNLRLLELALEEMPDEPHLIMNYGLELARSGRVAEGLQQYQRAFETMSQLPQAQVVPETREMLLAQFCTQLTATGQYEEIVNVLESPLALSGKGLSAGLHFTLGLALMKLSRFEDCAHSMRQCIAKRNEPSLIPGNKEIQRAGPRHCLAVALANAKQTEEAGKTFQEALAEDPASFVLRFDYAKFLAQNENPVEALQLLHTLAQERPDDVSIWVLGGQISLAHPEFLEVACDWTEAALTRHADNHQIQSQRAEALVLASRPEEALELIRELPAQGQHSNLACLILCENAAGKPATAVPAETEPKVSGEFIKWYQRLVRHGAAELVLKLNENLPGLSQTLPSAARLLESAIAEAGRAGDQ